MQLSNPYESSQDYNPEDPDSLRGTGRTTRMADKIFEILSSDKPQPVIFIYFNNLASYSQFKEVYIRRHNLKSFPLNILGFQFLNMGNFREQIRGIARSSIFIDHSVIENHYKSDNILFCLSINRY